MKAALIGDAFDMRERQVLALTDEMAREVTLPDALMADLQQQIAAGPTAGLVCRCPVKPERSEDRAVQDHTAPVRCTQPCPVHADSPEG